MFTVKDLADNVNNVVEVRRKRVLDNEEWAALLIKKFGLHFDKISKKEICRLLEDEMNDFQEGSSEYC